MFLLNSDLFDLQALIVFFRNEPERFSDYISAFKEISDHIRREPTDDNIKHNAIRNILRKYSHGDGMLSWYLVNNAFSNNLIVIKDPAVYGVISGIFCEMMDVYFDTDRFAMLCDAVHNVPVLLAQEPKPRKNIEMMIKPYRKNYNSRFLKNELKGLQ